MNLLLDTNAFLWAMDARPRLRAAVHDHANELFLSVVSAWEIGIKLSIGKLRLSIGIEEGIRDLDLSLVPVTLAHALRVADLPLIHRDPFDRLLIAQAMVDGLTVLTSDAVFSRYGVAVMSV